MRRIGSLIRTASRPASRLIGRLLSVPMFVKILGISILVTVIFGAFILMHTRSSMSTWLNELLRQQTVNTARSLASSLERPMVTDDLFSVEQRLHRAQDAIGQIRYVIVRDSAGRIVAHTFDRAVPQDLARLDASANPSESWFHVLECEEGLIFDAGEPILGGRGGRLQLGVSDRLIRQNLCILNQSVLLGFAICLVVGTGLTAFLARLLTRPLEHLEKVADRIGQGDFDARATVTRGDEIGRLAASFNKMALELGRFQRRVREKEHIQARLRKKILQTQEDERRNISRELHDQIGQSLLAILLTFQSHREHCQSPHCPYQELEQKILRLEPCSPAAKSR